MGPGTESLTFAVDALRPVSVTLSALEPPGALSRSPRCTGRRSFQLVPSRIALMLLGGSAFIHSGAIFDFLSRGPGFRLALGLAAAAMAAAQGLRAVSAGLEAAAAALQLAWGAALVFLHSLNASLRLGPALFGARRGVLGMVGAGGVVYGAYSVLQFSSSVVRAVAGLCQAVVHLLAISGAEAAVAFAVSNGPLVAVQCAGALAVVEASPSREFAVCALAVLLYCSHLSLAGAPGGPIGVLQRWIDSRLPRTAVTVQASRVLQALVAPETGVVWRLSAEVLLAAAASALLVVLPGSSWAARAVARVAQQGASEFPGRGSLTS